LITFLKKNPHGVQFNEEIKHVSHRCEQPGLVEIWPLVETEEKIDYEPWTPPIIQQPFISTGIKLAQQIVNKVDDLLKSQVILPSTKKPVRPQDILILVKRRARWIHSLLQQLKQRNIPVAGIDRIQLKDHMAILDLLALGRFLCLPMDDYSLACVLKSPLINKGYGFTEEQLFELCYDREENLWQSLLAHQEHNPIYQDTAELLKKWLNKVDFEDPFQLFHGVLRDTESQFVARLGQECQEILNEFLQQALNYQQAYNASLQGFIEFIDCQETDIKRSVSSQTNQVRLMTIHGSKGLQAPIVILADSGDQPSLNNELFLWQEKENPLFFLKPSLKNETDALVSIKSETLNELSQEQRRLLYVALTRSQDQLYIAGLAKRSKAGEWYALLTEVLQELGVATPDGGWCYQPLPFDKAVKVEEKQKVVELPIELKELPVLSSWMTPRDSKTHIPNSPEQKRGIIIHRLLEILGGLPNLVTLDDYNQAGRQWCLKNDNENLISGKDLEAISNVLTNVDYRHFFGPLSASEVEVCNGNFHGRIDRLAIVDETVFVLDYKTGSPSLKNDKTVYENYSLQLQNYKQALSGIYKNYPVRTFLLWTDDLSLVEIL
jgi:ATP-dependent helicase/nuclease subunit A